MNEIPDAVLFACNMNAVRSPMAESILKYLHGHRVYVDSAGVVQGEPDAFVIAVMDEIGIDLSRHKPKRLVNLEDSSFDLIVTLSPEAQHHAVEMTRTMAADVEFWPTLDPSYITGSRERRLGAYRQIRDQLLQKIKERFPINHPVDI
jgi:protein-tyrosine-phosphatase